MTVTLRAQGVQIRRADASFGKTDTATANSNTKCRSRTVNEGNQTMINEPPCVVTIDNEIYGELTWRRVAWWSSPTKIDPEHLTVIWGGHCFFCGASILIKSAAVHLNRDPRKLICPHHPRLSSSELYSLRYGREDRPLQFLQGASRALCGTGCRGCARSSRSSCPRRCLRR